MAAPGEDIELPPLGESDALVRLLVGRLSTHPAVAAWLATDGLIRNATVAVQNVAAGETPARHLRRIAPQGAFAVRARGLATRFVDPRSYQRYNWIADAVASIDTEGSARLYSTLRPRVEEAYAELGSPDTRFDATLERAIVVLLETPVVEGDVRLVTRGALYAYADPRLEDLSPAQKQLVRTGPRNTRLMQAKLREIALALGCRRGPPAGETAVIAIAAAPIACGATSPGRRERQSGLQSRLYVSSGAPTVRDRGGHCAGRATSTGSGSGVKSSPGFTNRSRSKLYCLSYSCR